MLKMSDSKTVNVKLANKDLHSVSLRSASGYVVLTWSPWRCVINILLILAAFTLLRISCVCVPSPQSISQLMPSYHANDT